MRAQTANFAATYWIKNKAVKQNWKNNLKAKAQVKAQAVQQYIVEKSRILWKAAVNFAVLRPRASLGIAALWLLFVIWLGSWKFTDNQTYKVFKTL